MINKFYCCLLLLPLLLPLLYNDRLSPSSSIFIFVNGLTGCETLSSELCLAAYPMCMTLILTSCCIGQTPLCLNIDTVINYSTNKKSEIQNCLQNVESGISYELWGDMDDIPGFEILPIPNTTCRDLGCENRGFDCVYEPTTMCIDPTSPCCTPQASCKNFLNKFNFQVLKGRINCDLPCKDGFHCRVINEIMMCIPSNCSLIECPPGTQCLPLEGLDIVSCFKKIETIQDEPLKSNSTNLTCENLTCPPEFMCSGTDPFTHSPYSNATCIPDNFNVLGNNFNCSECPTNSNFTWVCRLFGWSGFCVEIDYMDYGNEFECFGLTCLPNQICNSTSQQCEYEKCTNTTCHPSMVCFQNHPSSPRICSANFVFPTVSYPVSLEPFVDHFNDTGSIQFQLS